MRPRRGPRCAQRCIEGRVEDGRPGGRQDRIQRAGHGRDKAALLADEQVKGSDISVETKEGTVTLTGNAQSPAQKQRAEQLAMNVDGVRGVNNNITAQQ